MIIKRFLGYICLAVTLSAVGCSKSAIEEEKGIPMAFGAEEAVTESRTLLDGTSVNQSGNQLTVYDRYTPESGNVVTYMDGTVVTCNGTEWIYSPIKYWTETGTHSFMAYLSKYKDIELGKTANYPTVTYSDDTETLNVGSDTSPWEITTENQFDFMYACHTRYMGELNPHRPVELQLNHLLCAVQFNVVNLIPAEEVLLNSFFLQGVYNKGYASIMKDQSVVININDNEKKYFMFAPIDALKLGFNNPFNVFSGMNSVGVDGYVLLWPHEETEFAGINMVISYKNGTSNVGKVVFLSEGEIKKWRAGQRYIYNFYIEDNRISFEVKVVPWVEDDVIIEE